MIKVGQKVSFKPFKGQRSIEGYVSELDVEGVVHYVHPTNHWFNIEYGGDEGRRLIAFKFDDIGKLVRILEGRV
jgi:hypothetical protein